VAEYKSDFRKKEKTSSDLFISRFFSLHIPRRTQDAHICQKEEDIVWATLLKLIYPLPQDYSLPWFLANHNMEDDILLGTIAAVALTLWSPPGPVMVFPSLSPLQIHY
jgi:hypothetical protein